MRTVCAVIAIALLCAAAAFGQTKPSLTGMRGPSGGAGPIAVLINPDGSIQFAAIDQNTITVDAQGIHAKQPSIAARTVEVVKVTAGTPSYQLQKAPSANSDLDVALNGIVLSEGVDYTLLGATVTFIVAQPGAGDILRLAYR